MRGKPRHGVYRGRKGAAGPHLEMEVRACRVAGRTHVADVLPGGDFLAGGDVDAVPPHMGVGGGDGLPFDRVLNHDEPTPSGTELGDGHDSIGGAQNGGAVGCGKVKTGVDVAEPGDGLFSPPEPIGLHIGTRRKRNHDLLGLGRFLRRQRPTRRGRCVRAEGDGATPGCGG